MRAIWRAKSAQTKSGPCLGPVWLKVRVITIGQRSVRV